MPEIAIGVILLVLLAWKSRELLRLGVRGLCFIAIAAALASVGRALFQGIPSVQPASFIIMICGAVLGGGAGLFCGVLTALISSFFAGIGPWTVWQMLLWGLMGLLAPRPVNAGIAWRTVYGFAWGFIFGWGMNLWYPLAGFVPVTWEYYIASCVASAPMDFAHAATNSGLLLAVGAPALKIAARWRVEQ